MTRFFKLVAFVMMIAAVAFHGKPAHADGFSIWFGDGNSRGGWHDRDRYHDDYHSHYYGHYHGYDRGYGGYSAYYYSPPVIYAAPPAPIYIRPSVQADQTSPTYVDEYGRVCRNFYANSGYDGRACLQPDGTWRVVP